VKRIIIVTCTSYTVVSVLASLLSGFDAAPVFAPVTMLQLFLLTLAISVLMFIAEKIAEKLDFYTLLVDLFVRLAICFGVVFFGGMLFGWFTFSWGSVLQMLPLTLPTFAITYVVAYVTVLTYAQNINEALNKRKEKSKND
jgi:Protein of unknown function (DUF3021).